MPSGRRRDRWLRHATLAGERRVAVTDKNGARTELIARDAVAVCTGSRAAIPPIPGLAEAHTWTSREATRAEHAPRRLVIPGGGVVRCEMATAWSQLGIENGASRKRCARASENRSA
jgi:dihydrolipoamide dehydrogenase